MTPDQTSNTSSVVKSQKLLLARIWVPLVLILAALGVSGTVTVLHTEKMSPVDEWVYLDYLYKFPTQIVVQRGEEIGHDALEIMACYGEVAYGRMGPPCGSDYESRLAEFPYQGKTSADLYTPVYFGITWAIGGAIHLVSGLDLVTSWRLTGPLWQGLSVLLLFFLFRLWGVRPLATLALGLALIASPFSWWTYTYVSTDAPSFALGALLLIAATKFVRGQWSGWWIVAISALAICFKATNILAIGLVALFLFAQWLFEARGIHWSGIGTSRPTFPKRRWLGLPGFAIAAGAAAGGVVVTWTFIRSALALTAAPDMGTAVPFNLQEFTNQFVNFLPNTIAANVELAGTTAMAYPVPAIMTVPLSFLTVAGVIGAFWSLRSGSDRVPLVVAVALAAVASAPFLAIVLFVSQGEYFELPARYGASILGGMLLLAGLTMRFKPAVWVTLSYAILLTVVVVGTAPFLA